MAGPLDDLTRIASNVQQNVPSANKSFKNFSKVRPIEELAILGEVLEEMVEQLRRREQRYQVVIDAQDSLIVRATPDGKFTFTNQAYEDVRGHANLNDLSKITGEDYHPGDREATLNFITEVNRSLTAEDPTRKHEVRIKNREGDFRWYQWTVTGIFDDQGELTEIQTVGQDITELKDVQKELERANIRLREISHELINAAEQERNKIAREVHDDMLNYISELVLNLEGDIPAFTVSQTYQMIAERLRETVYNLRPPMLSYGLSYGLKDYIYNLSERLDGLVEVNFDLKEGGVTYPKDVDIHVFRIVQQACENSVEHASAANIRISGELLPDQIHLTVVDDGVGFGWDSEGFIDDSVGESRFGLAGLLERGLIVGAEVNISSEVGAGTRIEVMWREEERQKVSALE
jgi:PAS domain S-box-containing protein